MSRQSGEQARLKVVQGPDMGAVYVITGARVMIGRGEENDLVVADLKASRNHAELSAGVGGWTVIDQGSANGLLHNGQVTRKAVLKMNDTLTLGETVFEFSTSEALTHMLVAPPRNMEQLEREQIHLAEHQASLKRFGIGALFQNSMIAGVVQSSPRRKILLGVGAVAIVFFIFGDDGAQKSVRKPTGTVTTGAAALAQFLPEAPYNKEVEMIFKDGLREYFSGNYNRARTQFETVLQILPDHSLAVLYLENCSQKIESDVKLHLEQGKKAFQAGKLRDARAHFSRIMRLLYKDQVNPAYLEASEQLGLVNKAMSREVRS